jgi:hypothetical protein
MFLDRPWLSGSTGRLHNLNFANDHVTFYEEAQLHASRLSKRFVCSKPSGAKEIYKKYLDLHLLLISPFSTTSSQHSTFYPFQPTRTNITMPSSTTAEVVAGREI